MKITANTKFNPQVDATTPAVEIAAATGVLRGICNRGIEHNRTVSLDMPDSDKEAFASAASAIADAFESDEARGCIGLCALSGTATYFRSLPDRLQCENNPIAPDEIFEAVRAFADFLWDKPAVYALLDIVKQNSAFAEM